jgi:signal transduction histidine kinase
VQTEGKLQFTFRNTSKEELNISADELMERFVRGDKSRYTDGNGLGLSIARSLTESMGGKMNISIDGDLFKVTIEFDKL